MKKSISLRIEEELCQEIDRRADLMNVGRTDAIILSILNSKIFAIKEGPQLVALLHKIDCALLNMSIEHETKKEIKEACDGIWQLLNLSTEKIQREIEK